MEHAPKSKNAEIVSATTEEFTKGVSFAHSLVEKGLLSHETVTPVVEAHNRYKKGGANAADLALLQTWSDNTKYGADWARGAGVDETHQSSKSKESKTEQQASNKITFDDLYEGTTHRRLSADLPENTEAIKAEMGGDEAMHTFEAKYREQLEGYGWNNEAVKYARSHPELSKYDFANYTDPNIGWKVHLNVTPESARKVADYLRREGYMHKFLSGGLGTEGKAFTVYFGSKSILDKWAPQISSDLGSLLCKPIVNDETEVSPGVVARFTSSQFNSQYGEDFLQYGSYGLAVRKNYMKGKWPFPKPGTEEHRQYWIDAAKDAYEHLSKMYKGYFHG